MKERNVTITLSKAREWFNSGDATLREIALQAFSKEEIIGSFRDITTLKKACEVLGIYYKVVIAYANEIAKISRASAAMYKLNIIRRALNFGQGLCLTKDPKNSNLYYPHNPFVTENSTYYESELNSGKMEVIGKIKSEGEEYNILGGSAYNGSDGGLGSFCSDDGVGFAHANFSFLGCISQEIAQHFGKYFGMLITEAKYGDMPSFEIEHKYTLPWVE